jgi:predicted acylesterase/phospholipase RssA/CRP-like cAMP-binding protein
MSEAQDALRRLLGAEVSDATLDRLLTSCARLAVRAGDTVFDGAVDADALFVVGEGALWVEPRDVSAPGGPRRVEAGAVVGGCHAVVPELRFARARTLHEGWVLRVPRRALEAATQLDPAVFEGLSALSHQAMRRNLLRDALPRVLGALDEVLLAECERRISWVSVVRGEAVVRQGERADAWFVVATGRLQVVQAGADGAPRVLGEIGRGEGFGEAALLSGATRTASVVALRDAELMRLGAADLEALVALRPSLAMGVARELVRRTLHPARQGQRGENRTNLCVVPLSERPAVQTFIDALAQALTELGATLHLRAPSARARASMTMPLDQPEDHPTWSRFVSWLDEHAEGHRFVLIEADAHPTPWTQRVLREADEVLLVGDARDAPDRTETERSCLDEGATTYFARRTLVLIHPDDALLPRGTAAWLDARSLHRHLHVRDGRVGDAERVARTLAGRSVGLVLGAGGARGFAHVGVVRALNEAQVPADHVGGTSIGALVGALVAMGVSPEEMVRRGKELVRMRPFGDYALPITSVLRGRRAELAMRALFSDLRIEDLWLPFFCNSCDISLFCDVLHLRGSLTEAVLASTALPGVLPPRVLGSSLHVDGGTTDMLPGETMRARNSGPMIAVDVSTERRLTYPLARYPTSWSALWQRLRRRGPETPTLPELFMRAGSLSVARRIDAVSLDADLFLRPPVQCFGTVQLDALDEIEALGHAHAAEALPAFRWREWGSSLAAR